MLLFTLFIRYQWYQDKNFSTQCSEKLVKLNAEGGKRILAKPRVTCNKRNLLPLRLMKKLSIQSMTFIICVIWELDFYAFFDMQLFQSSELCRIKSSDIKFHDDYMLIPISGVQSQTYAREVTLYKKLSQNLNSLFFLSSSMFKWLSSSSGYWKGLWWIYC